VDDTLRLKASPPGGVQRRLPALLDLRLVTVAPGKLRSVTIRSSAITKMGSGKSASSRTGAESVSAPGAHDLIVEAAPASAAA